MSSLGSGLTNWDAIRSLSNQVCHSRCWSSARRYILPSLAYKLRLPVVLRFSHEFVPLGAYFQSRSRRCARIGKGVADAGSGMVTQRCFRLQDSCRGKWCTYCHDSSAKVSEVTNIQFLVCEIVVDRNPVIEGSSSLTRVGLGSWQGRQTMSILHVQTPQTLALPVSGDPTSVLACQSNNALVTATSTLGASQARSGASMHADGYCDIDSQFALRRLARGSVREPPDPLPYRVADAHPNRCAGLLCV